MAGSAALACLMRYRLLDCGVALGRSPLCASVSISEKWSRHSCCIEEMLDVYKLELCALVFMLASVCWVLCSKIYKDTGLARKA